MDDSGLKIQTDIGNVAISTMEKKDSFTKQEVIEAVQKDTSLLIYSQETIETLVHGVVDLFVKIGLLQQREDGSYTKLNLDKKGENKS